MNEKDNDLNKEDKLPEIENENAGGVELQDRKPDEAANEAAENEEQSVDSDADSDADDLERKDQTNLIPAAPAASRNSGKAWMYIALGLAVLLVIALVKPPFAGTADADPAVATVNGVAIGKDKLYNAMADLGGKQTLDGLIQEELVKQEADKAGITVGPADIDKEITMWKGRFNSEAEFDSWLQQNGMTLADFKKQMPLQIRIRKLLEPKTTVTDDQIKQYFEQNKASFNTPEEVRASHILVKTKAEAEDILKQLKAGADFAKLATEKSIDPGSKDKGGDLDFFPRGVMEKPFEDAAFALKTKGELSPIVQSSNGFHIIKLTDRKEAHTATLDEKKAQIKDQLVTQQISQLSQQWLTDLKAKAKITNTLETASPAQPTSTQPATATSNGQ